MPKNQGVQFVRQKSTLKEGGRRKTGMYKEESPESTSQKRRTDDDHCADTRDTRGDNTRCTFPEAKDRSVICTEHQRQRQKSSDGTWSLREGQSRDKRKYDRINSTHLVSASRVRGVSDCDLRVRGVC